MTSYSNVFYLLIFFFLQNVYCRLLVYIDDYTFSFLNILVLMHGTCKICVVRTEIIWLLETRLVLLHVDFIPTRVLSHWHVPRYWHALNDIFMSILCINSDCLKLWNYARTNFETASDKVLIGSFLVLYFQTFYMYICPNFSTVT